MRRTPVVLVSPAKNATWSIFDDYLMIDPSVAAGPGLASIGGGMFRSGDVFVKRLEVAYARQSNRLSTALCWTLTDLELRPSLRNPACHA
jgi:hypothetical protein